MYVRVTGSGLEPHPAGGGSAISPLRHPSWCRHSSLLRRRRMRCSAGRSPCGNPLGASVGRSWAPWHRGPSCPSSRPTYRAGGSTQHSPWRVLSVFTAVALNGVFSPVFSKEDARQPHIQQATMNLKVSVILTQVFSVSPRSAFRPDW